MMNSKNDQTQSNVEIDVPVITVNENTPSLKCVIMLLFCSALLILDWIFSVGIYKYERHDYLNNICVLSLITIENIVVICFTLTEIYKYIKSKLGRSK